MTQLTIKDNGSGMDLEELRNNGRLGQGLSNIRTRARLMDAALDLSSQLGQGFQLILTIPCDNSRHPQQIDDRPKVGKRELADREREGRQVYEGLGLETAAVNQETKQGQGT
jgi:hypothetical protein